MASEFSTLTLENALEDLSSRFIVNLPQEELESEARVLFQIEQAHWYYEDFIRPAAVKQSLLPSFALKPFSLLIFRSCPLLHDLVPRHAEIWADFMAYKERVPVCGAILISESWDKVLMVKGYQKGASWSFPRGKINKDEPEADCAVREVLEETGYDIFPHFPIDSTSNELRDPYYVELVVKEQRIRLYFIPNVSETAYFETRTRKEISKIDWFAVKDLPTYKSLKKGVQPTPNVKQPKFYMITPFVTHLKLWIQANRPKKAATSNQKHRPPHLEDEYRPPLFESDIDVGRSTSPSNDSSEEVEILDPKKSAPIRFETAEEGTAALQAFFFGTTVPVSRPAEEWKEDVAESEEEDPLTSNQYRTVTPPINYPTRSQQHTALPHDPSPILAFERQQPLVQPKPKASTTHTNLLLALLTSKDPVASPPPSRNARPISPPTTKSDHPLLSNLDNLLSQAPPPPPLPNYSSSLPSLTYLTAPPSITPVDAKVQEKLEKRSNLLSVLNDITFSNPGSAASPSSVSSHGQPSPRTRGNGGLPIGHSPQHVAPTLHFTPPSTVPPLQQIDARSNLMSIFNNPSNRISDQDSQAPPVVSHTPQQRQMLSLLQQSFNAPPVPPHPPIREESTRPIGYGPPPSHFLPPSFVVHHTIPVDRPPFSFPPNQPPQQYLPQQIPPNFAHPPPQQYQPFPPPQQHPQHRFQQHQQPNQPPTPQQFRQFPQSPPNPSFPALAPRFVSPPTLPPTLPVVPVQSRSVEFPPLPPPVPINPVKTQQSASLLSIFNQRQVEA